MTSTNTISKKSRKPAMTKVIAGRLTPCQYEYLASKGARNPFTYLRELLVADMEKHNG